jgi:chemotaxis signal transduction protein
MEDGSEFIGLLVDRVDEVVETELSRLQPPPANISTTQARFFKGICRAENRVITLLDSAIVLSEAA